LALITGDQVVVQIPGPFGTNRCVQSGNQSMHTAGFGALENPESDAGLLSPYE
jgi:hypothetical protein